MAPDHDFAWLQPAIKNLKFDQRANPTKRSRLIPVDRLMAFGLELMHEAEGHIVTVELKNGETYRGKLLEVCSFRSLSFICVHLLCTFHLL